MIANNPISHLNRPPVLLVTGGDSGIGLGIARKFVEADYRVAIGGLDRRKGHRVVATLGPWAVTRSIFSPMCAASLKSAR